MYLADLAPILATDTDYPNTTSCVIFLIFLQHTISKLNVKYYITFHNNNVCICSIKSFLYSMSYSTHSSEDKDHSTLQDLHYQSCLRYISKLLSQHWLDGIPACCCSTLNASAEQESRSAQTDMPSGAVSRFLHGSLSAGFRGWVGKV